VLHGSDNNEWIDVRDPAQKTTRSTARSRRQIDSSFRVQWKGVFPAIDQATKASWHFRKQLESLVSEIPCRACGGSRLQPLSRHVRFGDDRRSLTLHELSSLPLAEALRFVKTLKLDRHDRKIAGELLHEVKSRLQFLVDVGLDYVSLHRGAPTLSGGESQRIRLASQIGSGLTGVLYVLDEPTIGLHPRDNRRLIAALNKLRDWGNTLCIVEHDRDVIRNADCVLDFGPGAGREGGHIVAQKSPQTITKDRKSLTGKYLAGREAITIPTNRRNVDPGNDHRLDVLGCRHNNLKDIDVSFPLGRFIAVTGVSGSGKSSLVNDIVYKALASRIHRARLTPGSHDEIEGMAHIDKVINVDQTPIGQTPSSNPATYTKVFDVIRELFAKLTDSKIRGYTARRFSFNRPGGRCEECSGLGEICIEMHFMPDVWITCEDCGGRRYNPETLAVSYKGKSIADVLEMRVSEGVEHFKNVPKVRAILQTLIDVGLGYVQLGQSATTLSGGEAQRVKLAAELARRSTGKTVYILDEPTTGLHFEDCKKLLDVLHRLVDLGNTVICIEHNMDLAKTADWIIDIGPEAGDEGGRIVVADTPERVAKHKKSHTGKILAEVLKEGRRAEREIFTLENAARQQADIDAKLELVGSEADVKMPWEQNGRRWHTAQCLASDGERPRWDSQALGWLVDQMEAHGNLQTADWNHRSRIEVRAPGSKSTAWFCHILTRGPWLLECTFRVAKRSFDARKLDSELALKTLDEREDLPVYGQWRRVKRRVRQEFDDIRVHIHDLAEIDTPAFRRFLKSAIAGYLKTIGQWQEDPESAEPWKTDGRKWHTSQKAVSPNRRKLWKPTLLMELVGRLNKCVPDLALDWNHKTAVVIKHPAMDKPWGKIVTSSRHAMRLELRTARGRFTPAKVERLGPNPEIKRNQHCDWIITALQSMEQIDARQLKSVMLEAEESLLGRQLDFAG
jgi:excinuclease ABC subunit A